MVDWCGLPEGISALIARRLQLIEDFIAFRATCSSWRKETTFMDFVKSSCPKLPLFIHFKFDLNRTMYKTVSVGSKGKSCKFAYPELKGMEYVGSNGWLIMAERGIGNMCLFHPLTRAQIPLPNAPPNVAFRILRRAALSASPSGTPDYAVMIACRVLRYVSGRYVGFWKPGNETWTRIEIPDDCVQDLNYYNGKFYALTWGAQVWMFDLSGPDPDNLASKITELPWLCRSRPQAKLVECGGRLLVVAPFYNCLDDTPYKHDLEMVEIDVINGSYNTITSLGSSTVFIGRNQGFSIDANIFQGIIEPNLIYFSDRFSRIAAPGPPTYITEYSSRMGIWLNF